MHVSVFCGYEVYLLKHLGVGALFASCEKPSVTQFSGAAAAMAWAIKRVIRVAAVVLCCMPLLGDPHARVPTRCCQLD